MFVIFQSGFCFSRLKMFGLFGPIRALGNCQSGINQGDMRVSLREITQQSFCGKVYILAEKSDVVAVLQNLFEHFYCLLLVPDLVQALNHPKGAYRERRLRYAEIIRCLVAIH